jgi:hypothetical protein
MSSAEITLHDFFRWDEIHLNKEQLSQVDASKAYSDLRKTVSKEARHIKSLVTSEWLIKELGTLLKQLHLVDILVGAWNKSRQLNKFLDPEKYPPDEEVFVPLLEHTITSTQRPSIEVLLGERLIGKVKFEINLNLTLQGVVLKIQGGKIREIRSASVKGKGKIQIEGANLLEKETESWTLPGVIELGEGKPIERVVSKAKVA